MPVLGLLWLIGVTLLLVVGVGYAATVPLMRRRIPDKPDHPALYGMSCQEVSFPARDGLQLGGWWIPANPANGTARGTVILCPGQNGSMDKDVPQALPLHRAGFNVLMFDFRAHGRSEGQLVTLGALEQADLLGALDYLEKTLGIVRVGVLGFSMGAGVALLVAAYDRRIAALVADGAFPWLAGILAGWGRLRGLPGPLADVLARLVLLIGSLRAGYRLSRANPLDGARQITAPALLVHGEQDPFVSSTEIELLAGALTGPVEPWQVAGAGHREAYKNHPDEYNRRVVGWFETHLAS